MSACLNCTQKAVDICIALLLFNFVFSCTNQGFMRLSILLLYTLFHYFVCPMDIVRHRLACISQMAFITSCAWDPDFIPAYREAFWI